MDTSPPAIETLVLRTVLQRGWSIEPDDLTYMPKGGGSDHWHAASHNRGTYFVTVDDLDTKPWMGRDRSSVFAALTAAYDTAWSLHRDDGLALVVAPIRTDAGSVVVQIDDRYSVAVFPYIDGEAGEWARRSRLIERSTLPRTRRAPRYDPARCGPIARRRLELPERDALLNALATLDRAWTAGPYSEPAPACVGRQCTGRARQVGAL